tara:strand:- start:768 stop:1058 length:291 start_codon:yes stop_codon:yes gene_type:complete
MCSNCGYPETVGYWADAGAYSAQDRIRTRHDRTKKLKTLLKKYGLSIYDDGISPELQLSNLTGRVELVMDLDDLWAVAENLLGRKINPLEETFYKI